MYYYKAWLQRIVDGDTLHCGVDLGCDTAIFLTIRLAGINCPEMSSSQGPVAKKFAEDWFTANGDMDDKTGNTQFILHTIKDHREKYGRYLGEILPAGSLTNGTIIAESLNEALLKAGLAVVYDGS